MKAAPFVLAFVAGVIWFATAQLPRWGDPEAPASTHVSHRYIQEAERDTHTPNFVTAVLADYRGYDTLFEMAVIFTAGLACSVILLGMKKRER